ncbi:glutathione S-transferase [Altererythrobacter arenosus]|uniref:Glutathione S-transferase n=1 Tax=Altererythrobacter arenosus TaxID=3032592 RepID=A0ABY8FQD4_9SPHN|nr:glutathione S-transferase [Altererythrobacter sp. CAU 1644]WFL77229.1 glutathione S-transferase [Altererythrobacter sp. CAU 1644]
MITLHHLEFSQSFRILWLLEELGAEYELKLYNRDPETALAPAEYKALSPLGTAPVITDGELVLAESNAIIDYILDQYPDSPLRPKVGETDRARHLFWFHASQGSLMAVGGIEMIMRVLESRSPWPISKLLGAVFGKARESFTGPRTAALLAKLEQDLEEAPWFGGNQVTAADITMSYPMESLRDRGQLNERDFPNAIAWFERVEALPSYIAARKIDDRPSVAFAI